MSSQRTHLLTSRHALQLEDRLDLEEEGPFEMLKDRLEEVQASPESMLAAYRNLYTGYITHPSR